MNNAREKRIKDIEIKQYPLRRRGEKRELENRYYIQEYELK